MKLTIIRDMGLVHVDERGHDELDMGSVPSNVHAVQWDGSKGNIEYTDLTNEEITSLPSWAVDAAVTEQAKLTAEDAAEAKAEADRIAYENSTEGKAAEARANRDALLAETDWTANSDVVMSDGMAVYRQALRDITAQAGFPDTIVWPVKP